MFALKVCDENSSADYNTPKKYTKHYFTLLSLHWAGVMCNAISILNRWKIFAQSIFLWDNWSINDNFIYHNHMIYLLWAMQMHSQTQAPTLISDSWLNTDFSSIFFFLVKKTELSILSNSNALNIMLALVGGKKKNF